MSYPFPPRFAPSLWRSIESRSSSPDSPIDLGALESDRQTEVAIIGAGYSGLSAAHELQRRGVECVVLDANVVGWGASGRNGGVVSPKFRLSFSEIARIHGLTAAERMHRLAHESIRAVERFVADYNLTRAQFSLNGSVQCAHTDRALRAIQTEAEWIRTHLHDTGSKVLSRAEIADETGAVQFVGGVLSDDAGSVLPLAYVRGLGHGIVGRGVPIFENTPVLEIRPGLSGELATLITPSAIVRARKVIIATDAYSNLTQATELQRREIVPFRSAIIATEPLTEGLNDKLLARERSYTETRRMMKWFRKADGRMIFGGRDAFGKDGQKSGFESLRQAMVRLFPDLVDTPIEFEWSGYVSLTLDGLPRIGRCSNDVVYCFGYNGAGVAMASLLGQYAAALALGDNPDLSLLQRDAPKPIRCYRLAEPGVRMVAGYYQMLDLLGV
jgi:gamma-glutamylputrescine oxidase